MKIPKIIQGARCNNCIHYVYKKDDERHNMCNYSDDNKLYECDIYEAESCSGFKDKDSEK